MESRFFMSYKYTMLFLRTIFIVSIVWLSFFGPYKAFVNSNPITDEKYIEVYEGSSMYAVLDNLKLTSLINKLFFRIYLNINSIKSFQAGEYDIENKDFKEIIDLLVKGKTYNHSLTIIEGMNIYDIEKELEDSLLINDCSLLICIKTNYPFKEGVLYPDTYFYSSEDSLAEILINAELRMAQALDEVWINKNEDNLNSKSELLILASIIEKEAGNEEEKVLISSVFHNRLKLRMKLQTDPTIIYGLLPNFNGDITRKNLRDKSNPYNTYQISGLPPTPIAIPSISSLKAAANPIESSYIYFVSKGNGTHKFSVTYEEHLEAVDKYQLN